MPKPLSPKLYYEVLKDADPAFLGKKLLDILSWQVQKGQPTFFNLGWYLRLIQREWQVEEQRRRVEAQPQREHSEPQRIGLVLHPEEWVRG